MQTTLYPSDAVCTVCGITQRKLDYWVKTEVVFPTSYLKTNPTETHSPKGRKYHYFTYTEILQLKMIAYLRSSGMPLQRIREAMAEFRRREKELKRQNKEPYWLLSNGEHIWVRTADDGVLESLEKGEIGQLYMMNVLAWKPMQRDLRDQLVQFTAVKDPEKKYKKTNGKLHPWEKQKKEAV